MTAAITDFTQFAELRRGANNNDPAVLREVAGQFEALFLQTMLKTMREASVGDPLFGDSDGLEMYQGMLDQQLAVEMSSAKGIGLADMLVRQLGGETTQGAAARQLPGADFALPRVPAARLPQPGAVGAWQNPESFARDLWPHAQRAAERLNVSPEAVLAQAALETGWGKHVMPGRGGSNSHNLFGIKAGNGWSGPTATRQTIEFVDGIPHQELARFRAYDDIEKTFEDYVEFLSSNPRYAAVQNHGKDIDGFAGALAAAGYATDPAYAEKIARVANGDTMSRVLAPLKYPTAVSIND